MIGPGMMNDCTLPVAVPHLNVGHAQDPAELDRIQEGVLHRPAGRQIQTRCAEISLMARSSGRWREWYRFRPGRRLERKGGGGR